MDGQSVTSSNKRLNDTEKFWNRRETSWFGPTTWKYCDGGILDPDDVLTDLVEDKDKSPEGAWRRSSSTESLVVRVEWAPVIKREDFM
ncbi:hypothetical protein SKAU_G00242650 [Synaphobranchus kaupii]|uniref:Par3/HAL N-terminal domain-containing protein n=1 Tax=Synaphobranchus kaupii TaxID=118154 RepID=A0A9Q1F7U6_SYNKA|nr:hypothetical protein SKAU_G00242650 [Synaphobranchus kaupii]